MLAREPQELQRVGVLPPRIGIGEEGAQVAGGRGPQDGVNDGMGDGVRVGVAEQPLLEGDPLAAEDERPPLDQPVGVVPDADADQAATPAGSSSRV